MSRKTKLDTSLGKYSDLCAQANGKGKTVSVSKKDLLALLRDHGTMSALLQDLDSNLYKLLVG